MRGKKWLLTVVCALLVGVVCVLGNWLIDPFGVFEDSPLQWDSYAQTLNPRGSKVRYISERPGEYDSFVVGSSSAASYLPETLERYYGGSFYNMFHYGADTDYDRELVRYLLEQGEVTFSTPTIEGTILRRNKTDAGGKHPWKAEALEGDTPTATITGWYKEVYEPTYAAGSSVSS